MTHVFRSLINVCGVKIRTFFSINANVHSNIKITSAATGVHCSSPDGGLPQ